MYNHTVIYRVDPDEGIEENTQRVQADDKEEIFPYKMTGLRPCTNYTAFIETYEIYASIPFCKFLCLITFICFVLPKVTYNVQDLLVSTEGNGSVSVQCVFVLGSTADGCHAIFTDTIKRNEYFNTTGSDNTIISLSTSGVYNCYDFKMCIYLCIVTFSPITMLMVLVDLQ